MRVRIAEIDSRLTLMPINPDQKLGKNEIYVYVPRDVYMQYGRIENDFAKMQGELRAIVKEIKEAKQT